jgi:hypothetical protein
LHAADISAKLPNTQSVRSGLRAGCEGNWEITRETLVPPSAEGGTMKRSGSMIASQSRGNPQSCHQHIARHRQAWLVAVVIAVGLIAMGSGATSALGSQTHPYTGVSFGPEGTSGSASFLNVRSIAVDQTTGDVYVYDLGAEKIYKFDSAGGPIDFSATGSNAIEGVAGNENSETQIAVSSSGPTAGDLYISTFNSPGVKIFAPSGAPLGIFGPGGSCGVAVSPSGHVFVGTYPETITEYTPTANPVTNADKSGESAGVASELCNVAADGLGNIYSVHWNGSAERLEGIGATFATSLDPGALTIGVDPETNDVYTTREGSFAEYAPSGAPIGDSGSGRLSTSRGIAIYGATEEVYVGNAAVGKVEIFGPAEPVFEVAAESATGISGSGANLSGVVNPAEQAVTECSFEFGPTEGYGTSLPCEGSIPPDQGNHPVSAVLSGLSPATVYHFRITVVSSTSGTHRSGDMTFQTQGPTISGQQASNVGATTATLSATINPHGFETSYHFEYLSEIAYEAAGGFGGSDLIATKQEQVGNDEADHLVAIELQGLATGAVYRFRAVATSSAPGSPVVLGPALTFVTRNGEASVGSGCANEVLRAEDESLALPDCRAYELITAGFKNGGNFETSFVTPGARIETESFGNGFGGTESAGLLSTPYEFSRSPSGWTVAPLSAPASVYAGTNPTFNPLYVGGGGGTILGLRKIGQPGDAETLYRSHNGELHEIGPAAPPSSWHLPAGELPGNLSEEYFQAFLGVATPDTSHYVFTLASPGSGQADHLWPFDQTGGEKVPSIYEYVGTGNTHPFLLGVVGPMGSRELISGCGTSLGSYPKREPEEGGDTFNAVSADGSTIFFTPWGADRTTPCGSTASLPANTELYARINGETGEAHTVAISEPSAADCSACLTSNRSEGVFQGASEDGSKVFFLTEQELLPGNPGFNLYEYDFHASAGQKIVAISHRTAGAGEVKGVVRVSDDGSEVYFVATSVLTSTPNSVGATAVPFKDNMYAYDTTTQVTRFVASLSPADKQAWSSRDLNRQAEATPDGRYLLFASKADLTPDDTSSVSQLFRYDSATGQLVRISIGQGGFNDNGNTASDPATIPRTVGEYSFGQRFASQSWMSDDGEYVFFQSSAGLTPKALAHVSINAKGALAMNVYEYHAGTVTLISDGRDRAQSRELKSSVALIGTDGQGENVFFTTSTPLSSGDSDAGEDIYDARVGGGFIRLPATGCEGESCQGGSGAAPVDASPGSSALVGPGNPAHRNRKKKHHHKKHHHKKHHHKKQQRGRSQAQDGSSHRGSRK